LIFFRKFQTRLKSMNFSERLSGKFTQIFLFLSHFCSFWKIWGSMEITNVFWFFHKSWKIGKATLWKLIILVPWFLNEPQSFIFKHLRKKLRENCKWNSCIEWFSQIKKYLFKIKFKKNIKEFNYFFKKKKKKWKIEKVFQLKKIPRTKIAENKLVFKIMFRVILTDLWLVFK
jgi:hypothetical protein